MPLRPFSTASDSMTDTLRMMTVVALSPWREPQNLDDLVTMCQLSKTTDVTFLLRALPEQTPLLEKIHRFVEQFDRARQRLSTEGIHSAILIQTLLGHADVGLPRSPAPFQRIVGWDGTTCVSCFCPADPDFLAYTADVTRILAQARPTLIMVDDDVRLNNHAPATWSCACPHHLRALADLSGQTHTRKTLFEAMAGPTDEAMALRKQWLASGSKTLLTLSQTIRQAIDTVDPAIRCGQCISHSYDMMQHEPMIRALAGTTRPLARLGGSMYQEAGYKSFGAAMTAMALQHSTLSSDIECVCEADSYPHTFYSMSRRTLRGFVAGAILASRVNGVYSWIPGVKEWIPSDWTGYAQTLGQNHAYFESLTRLMRNVRWNGPTLICRQMTWQPPNERGNELTMSSAWSATFLSRLGIPFSVNDPTAAIAMLSGNAPEALDDATLRNLLTRGVLLDSKAAWHLCQRGFSQWLGIDVQPLEETPGYEREIINDHPRNGTAGGMHLSSACPDVCSLMRLIPQDPNTVELSHYVRNRWFHDTDLVHGGPASVAYSNNLGGRVVVFSHVLGDTVGYASQHGVFLNAIRKEQLVTLLGWLAGEPLPAVATATGDTYVLAGTDHTDHSQVVAVFNLNPDEETTVDLQLGDDRPRKAWVLDDHGQWQEVAHQQRSERTIQIQHPFDTMKPVVLRLRLA